LAVVHGYRTADPTGVIRAPIWRPGARVLVGRRAPGRWSLRSVMRRAAAPGWRTGGSPLNLVGVRAWRRRVCVDQLPPWPQQSRLGIRRENPTNFRHGDNTRE